MGPSRGLPGWAIVGIVAGILLGALALIYASQVMVESQIRVPKNSTELDKQKTEQEISKLDAEIRQIKSDTLGSLFWLKVIALFVTLGGAIGGYLVGQSRTTHARLEFENRKNVDAVYQSIVKELADESPVLRAAAAVKLGAVLRDFPHEWSVSAERREQMLDLTKKVLAAALAIEPDQKVLKTLSISIALHKPWAKDPNADASARKRADLRELDLSGAMVKDAYWARCDLSYADLYGADLRQASLRGAVLDGTQFREARLERAVLVATRCNGTSFKLADLRNADFSDADLKSATFDGAKVYGVTLSGAQLPAEPTGEVDVSEAGDGSQCKPIVQWLAQSAHRGSEV